MKPTFYGVEQRYYDNGKVSVKLLTKTAFTMPADSRQSLQGYDLYIDWFGTESEAIEWKQQALKA